MSLKINWDEVDKIEERKPYFNHGIWEVTIKDVDLDKNSNGNDFMRFTVEGENGEETDRPTMFLTEKALPWTMAFIQGALVHNAKTDLAKDKVRKYLRTVETVGDLDPTRLVGATVWLEVKPSDREFTREDGSKGYYDDFRLTHYKPQQKPEDLVNDMLKSGEPVEVDDVPFK